MTYEKILNMIFLASVAGSIWLVFFGLRFPKWRRVSLGCMSLLFALFALISAGLLNYV